MYMDKTRFVKDHSFIYEPRLFGDMYLIQVGRRFCDPTEIIKAHPHYDWFELTVVTSGRGTVMAGNVETEVKSGDIFLSLPCEIHAIRADLGDVLEYDFFSFYYADSPFKDPLNNLVKYNVDGRNRVFRDERIASLVKNAIAELSDAHDAHAYDVMRNIIHLIAVYLIRDFDKGKTPYPDVSDAEELCYRLMNYIDTHIYSIRSLPEVAESFNYNYGYLSGLFRKTTGRTLMEYLTNRRMETAKALILDGKHKIGEIADSLGYSPYSFSRAFKKKYGVTPMSIKDRD